MLNTRALTYPTPSDANLIPNSDGLVMLREGTHDTNRFFFFKGLPHNRISNQTNDPFNHSIVAGGNHHNGIASTILSKGGIIPFPTPSQNQYIGNEMSNHPVPVVNALVYAPIHSIINPLVDKLIPPSINPIAAR